MLKEKKVAAAKKKPGRKPGVLRTPNADAIKAEIIKWIANGGTLAAYLRSKPGLPDYSTIWDWRQADEAFSQAIARARDSGADAIADEAAQILDADPERGQDGKIDPAWVQLQRLRAEGRLKLLAKWNPKKYGDKVTAEHVGEGGGPLALSLAVTYQSAPARGDDDGE